MFVIDGLICMKIISSENFFFYKEVSNPEHLTGFFSYPCGDTFKGRHGVSI